ncbi:TspO/MBR family protein [Acuticoccus sp. I52.16.1]|uniref:TspO/MBR family protein n=1 Tax=Acuticoccus sp. I52.16.1 TaxID=2928472 RepID=UPI001FD2B123|nr:TspO/MBR family protein [Acuticoccus sp. I52.16.1]UOM35218.1 tryptophan-rich sensory protein [Acuticoccus sp. I52.16.1]
MNWPVLLIFILATLATAATGSFFRPGAWYRGLAKPDWTPPNWAFPVAWTILYATIAAAGYLFYEAAAPGERTVPLVLYTLQLGLNAAWSPLFFHAHRMGWALVDILVMMVVIAATILMFAAISPLSGLLLVPYLGWVGFASTLNYTILRLNDPRRRAATSM